MDSTVQPATSTATSAFQDQCDAATAVDNGVQVPVAAGLTAEQVRRLPVADLLARTNTTIGATLDLTDPVYDGVDTSTFFGYLAVRESGITLFLRDDATEEVQDVYIRYLLTVHLGFPMDHFPEILQHTVFVGPNLDEVKA